MKLFGCQGDAKDEEETVGLVQGEENVCEEEIEPEAEKESITSGSSSPIQKEEPREEKLSSNLQTSFNILNLIQGMGTLGIPYAVSIGGFIAVPCIIILGIITNYTGILIIDVQYDEIEDKNGELESDLKNRKPRSGYAAVGRAVCRSYGSKVVSAVQLLHLFGACVLYLILISNFLENVFPSVLLSRYACMALAGVLVFPTVFLTNLGSISWLSLISILFLNGVFLTLFSYAIYSIHDWKSSSLPFINLRGLSIANCIILFSYVAHPYLPRLEGSMKEPNKFNIVSNVAFLLATVTKVFFGMALACQYGNTTHQRVTNNISNETFRLLIDTCLATSGLFSYALPTNVIMNIIQRSDVNFLAKLFPFARIHKPMSWAEKGYDTFMRLVLVASTVTVGMLIPEFSLLMAIFGSVTAVSLVLVFPAYFHTALKRQTLSGTKVLFNYSIIGFGIITGIAGLLSSTDALIEALEHSKI